MATNFSGYAQLRILGEIHGQETVNVMNFGCTTEVSDAGDWPGLLNSLATAMLACAVDALLGAVSSDWTLKSVDAKLLSPEVTDPVSVIPEGAAVGELSPTSVSFAASLIQIRTGGGGRRGRGRVFLPPAGESEIVNSELDSGTMTLLAAFVACVVGKFVGGSATESWRLGILSRKGLATSSNNFTTSFREATSLTPVQNVAVMGSRKKGHGR